MHQAFHHSTSCCHIATEQNMRAKHIVTKYSRCSQSLRKQITQRASNNPSIYDLVNATTLYAVLKLSLSQLLFCVTLDYQLDCF